MASDAFIHAGFNVMKTLRKSTPNGREKINHSSYLSTLL